MFTVQLEDVAAEAEITVLDMTGRIISSEELTYGVSSLLDLTSAANGTYIIRLDSSIGSEMKTIVVNK